MTDRNPSAERLRGKLARHGDALRMTQTEALYHAQVAFTCQLLDLVDEVTDAATAERIADAIFDRLAGAEVTAAIARAQVAQAEYQRIAGTARVHR